MKNNTGSPITINDLKEMEYSDSPMTPQQRLAIRNFDRYRFNVLTAVKSEEKFHQKFRQLQVEANLTNYEEFLKEEYL